MEKHIQNAFGFLTNPPCILFDGDDRTGDSVGSENLRINGNMVSQIKCILVYTFIYEGVANWQQADAIVTIKYPGAEDIIVKMDAYNSSQTMCGFLQAEELATMIDGIKAKRDYGVIIYTGFLKEELEKKNDNGVQRLLLHADILIDGHYIKELDDGKPYRGSSNQNIHLMTDRYKPVFNDYYNGTTKRNIEIDVEKDNVYMVGVPSKNGIEVWKQFKKKADGNRDAI